MALRSATSRFSGTMLVFLGVIAIALLGIVDFATGHELSFSIFYLAPIAFVTWRVGKRAGLALAALSALVWLNADMAGAHDFSHPLIPYWNALMRFGFFVIAVSLLAQLQLAYAEQTRISQELQASLDKINTLSGLIPICAWCKKIRNDEGYWQQVETYLAEHSHATFSHGMCQDCHDKILQSQPPTPKT